MITGVFSVANNERARHGDAGRLPQGVSGLPVGLAVGGQNRCAALIDVVLQAAADFRQAVGVAQDDQNGVTRVVAEFGERPERLTAGFKEDAAKDLSPFQKSGGGLLWLRLCGRHGGQHEQPGQEEVGRAQSGASHAAAPARAERSPRAAVRSSAGRLFSGGA